jgi:hypothetical protein
MEGKQIYQSKGSYVHYFKEDSSDESGFNDLNASRVL